jgi:type IV pilus assembly protein PilV
MSPTRDTRSQARGTTLLEAVIALSILLIGLVGMLRLQAWGANSDEGGRSYTRAMQVGQELLAGLQQLPIDDPRLAEQFTGITSPAEFGHLLVGGKVASSAFKAWSDSSPIPGVTLDAKFIAETATDPLDASLPRFQRRWTVWMPTTPITINSSKVIAVSVMWRERGFPQLHEVVLYGSAINAAAVTSFAGLSR